MQARRADPARRAALVAPLALALLLHALLLDALDPGPPRAAPDRTPALQVRSIAPAAPEPATPEPLGAAAAPTVPVPVPRPSQRREPPATAAGPALAAAPPAPASAPAEPAPSEEPASAPLALEPAAVEPAAVAEAASGPIPAEAAGGEPPPLYRTLLPPPATLDYELRRGRLAGSGTLVWRPRGERYELQLDGSVIGLRVLTQASQGGIDAHGLAPERFTDQRARRPVQAANFRRDSARISFSGPSHELPLWAGVQDRLSWMLQLAAVVAADPARWAAGERIVLQVVGARGDAAAWAFEVLGEQVLETPAGPLPGLHLRRAPRGPYDTGAEIWLDPARHHLPVRATLRSGADDALELRLRAAVIG